MHSRMSSERRARTLSDTRSMTGSELPVAHSSPLRARAANVSDAHRPSQCLCHCVVAACKVPKHDRSEHGGIDRPSHDSAADTRSNLVEGSRRRTSASNWWKESQGSGPLPLATSSRNMWSEVSRLGGPEPLAQIVAHLRSVPLVMTEMRVALARPMPLGHRGRPVAPSCASSASSPFVSGVRREGLVPYRRVPKRLRHQLKQLRCDLLELALCKAAPWVPFELEARIPSVGWRCDYVLAVLEVALWWGAVNDLITTARAASGRMPVGIGVHWTLSIQVSDELREHGVSSNFRCMISV